MAPNIIWFHCAWTKGRSWVGTNWLLVTTVELTGGLYMIWIMALWIIFELLLSAKHFLLYIFCSMAMELFGKVKVFGFEWILIYCTMGFTATFYFKMELNRPIKKFSDLKKSILFFPNSARRSPELCEKMHSIYPCNFRKLVPIRMLTCFRR